MIGTYKIENTALVEALFRQEYAARAVAAV
jgi:hypothetical protein